MRARFLALSLLLLLAGPIAANAQRVQALPSGLACTPSAGTRFELVRDQRVLIEGLLAYHWAGEAPLSPLIFHEPRVERGQALRVIILIGEELEELTVRLAPAPAVAAQAFPMGDLADLRQYGLLLGIPSGLKGGSYSLVAVGRQGSRSFLYRTPISVVEKRYLTESIPLDPNLSRLLTKADPRKDEELRQMRELLSTFNLASVYFTGTLRVPLEIVRRTAFFADRRDYRLAGGGGLTSIHYGIDLAAPEGTRVFAAGAGRVALAGARIISGNTVVVEHLPGVYSLYFHMKELRVKAGDRVEKGSLLGSVGYTGMATGAHLHWELRIGGVAVDPDAFLQQPLIDKKLVMSTLREIEAREGR